MKAQCPTFILLIATLLAPVAVQARRPVGVSVQAKSRAAFGTPATVRNRPHAIAPAVIGCPAKSKAAQAAEVNGSNTGHRH